MRQMGESCPLSTVVAREPAVDGVGGLWSWKGRILVAEIHSFLSATHGLASDGKWSVDILTYTMRGS